MLSPGVGELPNEKGQDVLPENFDIEKLRFRNVLMGTVGLTTQINLRFQISPAYCGRRFRLSSLFSLVFLNSVDYN